jgi:hypothetical protein
MKRILFVVAGLLFTIGAAGFAPPLEVLDEIDDSSAKAPPPLAKQIDEYNRLLHEKRFSQAAEISKAVFLQRPDDPAVRLMHEHTLLLQAMLDHGVDLGLTSSQREPMSVVYSVEGLLSPPRSRDGEDDSEPDQEQAREYGALIHLIHTRIAPKTWEPYGSGSIKPYVQDGHKALVVRHTQAVHNEVAELLRQLRELDASTVALHVQFFTAPTKLAEIDPGCQNPIKMKQEEAKLLFDQPPKKGIVHYPGQVDGVTVKVKNGQTRLVQASIGSYLKMTPMVGSDWRHVRLTIVDERAPENQLSVDLSSDECVAVEVSRLSVRLPRTPVEAALRDAELKGVASTVMIITPTIEHH